MGGVAESSRPGEEEREDMEIMRLTWHQRWAKD